MITLSRIFNVSGYFLLTSSALASLAVGKNAKNTKFKLCLSVLCDLYAIPIAIGTYRSLRLMDYS